MGPTTSNLGGVRPVLQERVLRYYPSAVSISHRPDSRRSAVVAQRALGFYSFAGCAVRRALTVRG
jgi:hypothetical protein